MTTPNNTPQTPDPQHYQTASNDSATTAGTASIQPTGTEQAGTTTAAATPAAPEASTAPQSHNAQATAPAESASAAQATPAGPYQGATQPVNTPSSNAAAYGQPYANANAFIQPQKQGPATAGKTVTFSTNLIALVAGAALSGGIVGGAISVATHDGPSRSQMMRPGNMGGSITGQGESSQNGMSEGSGSSADSGLIASWPDMLAFADAIAA